MFSRVWYTGFEGCVSPGSNMSSRHNTTLNERFRKKKVLKQEMGTRYCAKTFCLQD